MEQKLLELLTALGETKTTVVTLRKWAQVTVLNTPFDICVFYDGYMLLCCGCTAGKTDDVSVLVGIVRNYEGKMVNM